MSGAGRAGCGPLWRRNEPASRQVALCGPPLPGRGHQPRGLALLSLPARPAHGLGDAGGAGHRRQPRDRAAVGAQVRPGVRQTDPAEAAPRRRQVAPYVDGLGTQHLSYLSHADGSGVGERALSGHGHRTATPPAFSASSPRAYASSFLAPRPRPSPACVAVRCHSGGAGVESTRPRTSVRGTRARSVQSSSSHLRSRQHLPYVMR